MSTSSNPIESSATRRAFGRPTRAFKGHTQWVQSVAYFPDGRHIASGSYDGTVIIWDVESGREDGQPLRHNSLVMSMAISPDGRRIASGTEGGLVIWDALTREVVHEIKGGGVYGLAYSLNGRWIAAVPRVVGGMVRLWDATAPTAHESLIRLWDADTGRPSREPLKCDGRAHCVAFSPDGSQIAVGLVDGSFRVIDISTGECVVGPIKGHTDRVSSVVYSPDGHLLVTGSDDKSIRLWDSKTGVEVGKPMLGWEPYFRCVSITADGRRIASGGFGIQVWDLETRLQVGHSFNGKFPVYSAAFSPDDRYIIRTHGPDVFLYDTQSLTIQGSSSPHTASNRNPPVGIFCVYVPFCPLTSRVSIRHLEHRQSHPSTSRGKPVPGHTMTHLR
ncbi:WD40 repeat-like protein [Leucogyrophana mollusca]|uniref:WD40 repeat-like protein n=1 Tax=Leucogyrophana mollusca TaxID=85980 RepID=A0ACB8B1A8_9AGAM|nr:WD40 repeat-like protein [Leucogyrophana mollusca]